MTASVDGEVKLWPVAPASGGDGGLLAELAEYVAGGSIDAEGRFGVFLPDESLARAKNLDLSSDEFEQGDRLLWEWYRYKRD